MEIRAALRPRGIRGRFGEYARGLSRIYRHVRVQGHPIGRSVDLVLRSRKIFEPQPRSQHVGNTPCVDCETEDLCRGRDNVRLWRVLHRLDRIRRISQSSLDQSQVCKQPPHHNLYTRIKPSKDGIGVFAIRDIPKSTRLFIGDTGGTVAISRQTVEELADDEIRRIYIDLCPVSDGYFIAI